MAKKHPNKSGRNASKSRLTAPPWLILAGVGAVIAVTLAGLGSMPWGRLKTQVGTSPVTSPLRPLGSDAVSEISCGRGRRMDLATDMDLQTIASAISEANARTSAVNANRRNAATACRTYGQQRDYNEFCPQVDNCPLCRGKADTINCAGVTTEPPISGDLFTIVKVRPRLWEAQPKVAKVAVDCYCTEECVRPLQPPTDHPDNSCSLGVTRQYTVRLESYSERTKKEYPVNTETQAWVKEKFREVVRAKLAKQCADLAGQVNDDLSGQCEAFNNCRAAERPAVCEPAEPEDQKECRTKDLMFCNTLRAYPEGNPRPGGSAFYTAQAKECTMQCGCHGWCEEVTATPTPAETTTPTAPSPRKPGYYHVISTSNFEKIP